MRSPRQQPLPLPCTWGGKRARAGRKRRPGKRLVPHRPREAFDRPRAVHVTLRVASHVYGLRSGRSQRVIERVLGSAGQRFGTRIVQLSVQGDHVHFLIEAPDHLSLGKAMKGLGVRLARRMNAMMGKRGRVVADRYHVRWLRSPTEIKHVVHYIRHNHRKHELACGRRLPATFIDPCSSDGDLGAFVAPPQLYLVARALPP